MKHNYFKWGQALFFMLFLVSLKAQTTVVLPAAKDNSMFSENNNSNGVGDDLFTGRTNQGNLRRALIQFDLSSIPSDATITDAQLRIRGNRQSASAVAAHRLTSDWGEGASNSNNRGGGQGDAPSTNDATWNFSFFNTTSWNTAGGDFMPTASATTSVSNGSFASWTGTNVVADVQAWIDDDATNFGWILIGDENTNSSAIRLVSREGGSNTPELEVTYTVTTVCDADGGTLALADGTTELTICAGDDTPDPFMVSITDTVGTNFAWVITDDQGNILALPSGPTFDLDGAGPGICLLWGLSFEDGLTGAAVGSNASDLTGCFDLSNPITINREGVNGGNLTFADGSTELSICAGDGVADPFMVNITDTVGANFAWVITDDQGNILALPSGPTFDLEGAGDGVCLLWGLSFADGLTGAEVGNNASDLAGCFDLSNPITINRTGVDGGTLALADGTTELTICAGDDTPDPFMVSITDTVGTNFAWVITDDQGNILALPSGPTFDLDGAGPGICLLWGLSFEDGLTGATVGSNASDLTGCFDLSNPITINREGVNGGNLTFADGSTELSICAGDGVADPFMVNITDTVGANFAWVITDDQGNILALPSGPTFDLEGAGDGVCLLWGLSFADGLTGAEVGNNASDLMGCFDLSNPITINRTGVDGGTLALADGTTELTICAGDGVADPFMVSITDTVGTNFAWVITDDQGNILALPSGPTFDLEGAGPGICLLWGLSFEDGLTGAEIGNNASDLMGCFDLSNPITINREGVNGGNLTFADGSTELTICAGDGVADEFSVILTDTVGPGFQWLITDDQGNILALPTGPTFDLEGAGPGICQLWGVSWTGGSGLSGSEVGDNVSDLSGCFDLSNPITIIRNTPEGGNLTFADGSTDLTICAGDGVADPFMVNITDTVGTNFAWVITDDQGNILALPSGPTFDLEGAGAGVCLLWGLSFEDGLTGATVGNNASDLMGCFDLSNPITINRTGVDGGNLTFADGSTELAICAGDGVADPFMVNITDTVGTNFAWVITDDQGNILALPTGPTFDLEGAGAGVCLLWGLSFEDGLSGAAIGNNASDLMGCFDLSNPITIDRTGVDGGNLTFADGSTELAICAGDGVADPFMVNITDTVGTNFAWVITDDQGNILALPSGPTFDLEGAGAGICLLWGLSFEDGLTGAEVGNNASDLMGCFDLSNPITINRNGDEPLDGGNLTFADGSTELTICAGDGVADPFMVNITDTVGTNFAWVITDDQGNILALPSGPTFDLEGAGDGVCLLWGLSFSDGLAGAEVGNNASDLQGCFDLSNPITINRTGVDGGNLTFADGSTELTICAGDGVADPFMVNITDTVGTNFAWVITDDQGNILALPSGPTFDLDGAGSGICLLWGLSFEDGLTGAAVNNNASDLMGCFDLSNPITINRIGGDNSLDGGNLTFADGSTSLAICAGDGVADEFSVNLTDTVGTNFAWVITDDQGNILALPSGPTFDLEGAGDGVCLLWHLSFADGLVGAEVGANANDLQGCFDLSNPITIDRTGVDGGNLTFADGSTELTICAGDGVADPFMVNITDTVGANFAWVITDDQGNILALPSGPTFDLEGAGPGICLLWGLSFADGLTGAEVGNNASDLMGCFDLSNPLTINREGVNGGALTFANGSTDLTICAGDGVSDEFSVMITDTVGANFAWVITDDQGNILALPSGPTFDLEGAGDGVCLLWGLSFADGLTGAEVGNNASDLMGCFDLSNPITIDRNGVDGGVLELADGGTELTICAGDSIPDPFMVNITDTVGTNFAWVITDDQGNILGLPSGPSFDLEGAGPGICLLWGLSFEDGLTGAEVGNNASDLMGCFDLSNPITVTRDTTGDICITSTEEIVSAAEIGFEVFPNPAQDRIQFKANFTERPSSLFIEVRSSIGQLMIRKELDNQRELNETLDINQMTSGFYLITLRTERSVITKRFLKE